MQLVLGRKQIHKWDLNELKPTSQEKKKRGTGKGHGGGKKDFKDFACFYPHSSQKE